MLFQSRNIIHTCSMIFTLILFYIVGVNGIFIQCESDQDCVFPNIYSKQVCIGYVCQQKKYATIAADESSPTTTTTNTTLHTISTLSVLLICSTGRVCLSLRLNSFQKFKARSRYSLPFRR